MKLSWMTDGKREPQIPDWGGGVLKSWSICSCQCSDKEGKSSVSLAILVAGLQNRVLGGILVQTDGEIDGSMMSLICHRGSE
jgi:hypothetical protein